MTSTTQRLFVAMVPPEHVLEHLDELLAPMRASRPDLHWVAPRRMHVTVAFMPHVPTELVELIPAAVEAVAADLPPVRLSLARSGRFDDRVLWCGLSGDLDTLGRVAAATVSAVAAAGAGPERRRDFRPHLSLARAAGRLDAHLGGLAEQVDAYEGPVWQADALHVVHSHLGRSAHHETLAVAPLLGEDAALG